MGHTACLAESGAFDIFTFRYSATMQSIISGNNISMLRCSGSCWFLNSSARLLILPTSPSSEITSVLSRSY